MKKFFRAIYDFVTDVNGDGDIAKLGGAILMIVAIVRFAAGGVFDPVAFGSGAGLAVGSKALDAIVPKSQG